MLDARAIVESALRAMIAQDIQAHMRWIDDDVTLESRVTLPLTAKLRYLQECAAVLAPGSGIRLSHYQITRVGGSAPDGQWVDAILTFEAPKDGKLFPVGAVENWRQRSEASYRVRDDRIVHVRMRSLPESLRVSFD